MGIVYKLAWLRVVSWIGFVFLILAWIIGLIANKADNEDWTLTKTLHYYSKFHFIFPKNKKPELKSVDKEKKKKQK